MARLAKLDRDCEGGCGRVRTHLLMDRGGKPRGEFCEKCGTARYAELQADEDRRFGPLPVEQAALTDVRVPTMGSDEEFVGWLDRVIARCETDLAEASDRTARLTRAVARFREARAVLAGEAPVPSRRRPPALQKHSCPHCPRFFGTAPGLSGHIGKAHPGAKRSALAEPIIGVALSKTTIDHAELAGPLDAALAAVVGAPDLRRLLDQADRPAVAEVDGSPPTEPAEGLPVGDVDHGPGYLVCLLAADDEGSCGFVADDPGHLDRHLRRRHKLCGGDDPDDVEYRAEQVRKAQADFGQPATWGL